MVGYLHPGYTESFLEFGAPRELPYSQGWILERDIPGCVYRDAMGSYPRFFCNHWENLNKDLDNIANDLVSLALVTDPFGAFDVDLLKDCFDVVSPYKEHFIVDLTRPVGAHYTRHHQRMARKALNRVTVELCTEPYKLLDTWVALFSHLSEKHAIKGIRAFSRSVFERHIRLPGSVLFSALYNGNIIGLHWYIEHEDDVYAHLAALGPECYRLGVSYALHWTAIEYFSEKSKDRMDLGAGAGIRNDGKDGLGLYKRGWATGTMPSYFCGRIFDQDIYSEISISMGAVSTSYFPAYRAGEFT